MIPHKVFCNKKKQNSIFALRNTSIDSRPVLRYPRVIIVWEVEFPSEDGDDMSFRNTTASITLHDTKYPHQLNTNFHPHNPSLYNIPIMTTLCHRSLAPPHMLLLHPQTGPSVTGCPVSPSKHARSSNSAHN